MTANPMTPLDALRELLHAIDAYQEGMDSELRRLNPTLWNARSGAHITLDHYTRNGWDGPSVKARRIAAGLTQQQLAEHAGISLSTVRLWEQGYTNPSLTTIEKIQPILAQPHERETS
jgi:DNA-binding XRE family transcriptional regulator